jgi:hypothetical protein
MYCYEHYPFDASRKCIIITIIIIINIIVVII